MGLKFKNRTLVVINYDNPISLEEEEIIKSNYDVDHIDEIVFKCKGFGVVDKPWYLQSVDWVKLIPENVIKHDTFAIKIPFDLPHEISIYMMAEIYSRAGRLPRILEYRENGDFNRIVDLEYEINFSRNKRTEYRPRKTDGNSFNRNDYRD